MTSKAALPIAIALGLAASTAQAQGFSGLQGHNSNAPVDVSADRIEVQDRADRAVFSGSVHIVQGDMILDAARVTVAYANGGSGGTQIQRIDASGGVTVKSPSQTANGNFGIYDLNRRLITLLGGVTLIQGQNQVRGGRMVIDLNSGRATVDGSAVGGNAPGTTSSGRGGRVTGRFTVPQRTTPAQPQRQ